MDNLGNTGGTQGILDFSHSNANLSEVQNKGRDRINNLTTTIKKSSDNVFGKLCAHCQKDMVFNDVCSNCGDGGGQAYCDKIDKIKEVNSLMKIGNQIDLDNQKKINLINVINSIENIFNTVDYNQLKNGNFNINGVEKNAIIFKSHRLKFHIVGIGYSSLYFVNGLPFRLEDLNKGLGISFSKMRYKINLSQKATKSDDGNKVKENIIVEELKKTSEEIFIAKGKGGVNVYFLKYNGGIEVDNATIHFKVGPKQYRISKIKYLIIKKDYNDLDGIDSILINNENKLSFKVYSIKKQRWENFDDNELQKGLLYLTQSILINHNPYITS